MSFKGEGVLFDLDVLAKENGSSLLQEKNVNFSMGFPHGEVR